MAPQMAHLIAVFTFVAVASAQRENCTFDVLKTCQASLNTYLGVQEPKPWEQPVSYRSKVEALFENGGIDGLRKVCRGFREMKGCLKGCYRDLFNVAFLVNGDAQVAPTSAYTYASIFNSFHYLCGAGFGTYTQNQVCMTKAWKNSRQDFEQCRSEFESITASDPSVACSLGNALLKCYEVAFAAACGTSSRDTQFFGCEYVRTALFTKYPQCPLTCSLPVVG